MLVESSSSASNLEYMANLLKQRKVTGNLGLGVRSFSLSAFLNSEFLFRWEMGDFPVNKKRRAQYGYHPLGPMHSIVLPLWIRHSHKVKVPLDI